MRRGLFATRFGPSFYLGFTSQRPDLAPVALVAEPDENASPSPARDADASAGWRQPLGTALLVSGAAAAVAAGVSTAIALDAHSDYETTNYERPADEARTRFNRYQAVAWTSAGVAVALGGAGLVLLLWPEPDEQHGASASTARIGLTPTGVTFRGGF